MKIFCIGFNKTGTKTLHCWLEWVGIKSTHNVEWPQRTRELSDEQLMKYLAPHDAYSDGEMADFRRLSRLYPESIFLLNTRSMKSWLESRVKHVSPELSDEQLMKYSPEGIFLLNTRSMKSWLESRHSAHRR